MTSRRIIIGLLSITALSATVLATPSPASASANATPTYEIKLDLDSSALSGSTPSSSVLSTFGLSSPTQRSYEYLDTSALDLNARTWDVRVRHKAGKDLELSYKKRFAVSNGDIDAALDEANDAGFDASDTNYDAEVDWGYSRQTLSFSDEKSASSSGLSGTSLPSESKAISTAVKNIPGKLDDWSSKGWGTDELSASRVHGPVTSTVWSGTWEGTDASIEVVPVNGAGTVVELSFKTDDYDTAASVRSDAITLTDSKGWLLHTDILKTNLILSNYYVTRSPGQAIGSEVNRRNRPCRGTKTTAAHAHL